ncbi:MAG: hypothetical protein IJ403_00675 [Oscillospiraceae bacterium]|nr:hypothetical protein [Oscillospiraceae bacterium]
MEKYKLDVVSRTLTISKEFSAAVASGKGEEYNLYTRLMQEIPGLTVVRKTHRTPASYTSSSGEKFACNQFKNLKYENMERFMAALPDNEVYFEEYSFLRYSASVIQTNRYALVRDWFIAQFPEFRKNPLFYLHNKPETVKAATILEMRGDAA